MMLKFCLRTFFFLPCSFVFMGISLTLLLMRFAVAKPRRLTRKLFLLLELSQVFLPLIQLNTFFYQFTAFGIGSMIYSGLEFGQYFELETDSKCHNVLLALTPATRMAFIFIQMYFIFLNNEVSEN